MKPKYNKVLLLLQCFIFPCLYGQFNNNNTFQNNMDTITLVKEYIELIDSVNNKEQAALVYYDSLNTSILIQLKELKRWQNKKRLRLDRELAKNKAILNLVIQKYNLSRRDLINEYENKYYKLEGKYPPQLPVEYQNRNR